MVQTPFTWRYGGQHVYLAGSFNGWSERIPMELIEGSATMFQKVINLPSGHYQYKFFVDGTWQVDPQQICHTDEYGIVNNVVLVSETMQISPDLVAESSHSQPNTSHHINAEAVPFMGSSSNVQLNEPVLLGFLHGDADEFHRTLSTHLLSHTAYEIIPVSGKVIALDAEVGLEQAFHVMHDEGLNVMPLWEEHNRQMSGMLTASDFILILLQLYRSPTILTSQQLQIWTISTWKEWKQLHCREIVWTSVPHQRRPLICAGPDDSLGEMTSMILRNDISSVPVLNMANGSSVLLHVTCLAGVLKNICSYFKDNAVHIPLLQQPIGSLPVGTQSMSGSTRQLLTLQPNDLLTHALSLFLEAQISSMPVTDKSGNIIDIFSRSDIISLARDDIYARIQLDQITVSQALEIAGEGRGQNPQFQTCTMFDSLYRVMEILSEPNVRRVIVVDAISQRHLEGIITLRDVIQFFLQ